MTHTASETNFECFKARNNVKWKRRGETLTEMYYTQNPNFLFPSGYSAVCPVQSGLLALRSRSVNITLLKSEIFADI